MRTLIKNVQILTLMDDKTIENGYILINDDRIEYIGQNLPTEYDIDTVINGDKRLAIPGLINCHTHTPMSLMRSYADDMCLENWLFDYIFPIEEKLKGEDVYWGAMLSISEMIKSGTTTFADMYYFMDQVAEVVIETNMRACLSRGCQKLDDMDRNAELRLEENVELFKKYDNKNSLIRVFIGPHAIYTCLPDYLKECYSTSKELNTGMHIHIAETKTEFKNCVSKYGFTPIEHCNKLGILDSNTLAAHCVHLTDNDLEILKECNVKVAHNPTSNLKLGSGIAPVPKMLDMGINVCLGTDGAASNNNQNLFEEIHLTGILHKGVNCNPSMVSAYNVLKMATVNGAIALGYDDIGVLKVGNKADIVLIDMDKPHLYPVHNIISNLVYSAQGSDVDTVIINGKIVYNDGEFKTLDFEKVKYNVNIIKNKLFK